jgi:hypothetical protein
MYSTWLWRYFCNNQRGAAVGAMLSTKTSKTGSLKICVTKCHSVVEQTVAQIRVSGIWTFHSFESTLSRWTVVCPYLSNLLSRHLETLEFSLIRLSKVPKKILDTYGAGSSFSFSGFAFTLSRRCPAFRITSVAITSIQQVPGSWSKYSHGI